jgi:hypothetical protein
MRSGPSIDSCWLLLVPAGEKPSTGGWPKPFLAGVKTAEARRPTMASQVDNGMGGNPLQFVDTNGAAT